MNVKKLWPLIVIGFIFGFWYGAIMTFLYVFLCLTKEIRTHKHDKAVLSDFNKELGFYSHELDNPPKPEKMILFPDGDISKNAD